MTKRKTNPKPTGRPTHGRPGTLTQEVHDTIVTFVRAGNYIDAASALAGRPSRTVYDWLRIGARLEETGTQPATDYEQKCLAFSHAVRKAQAEAEAEDVLAIGQIASGGTTTSSKTVEVKDANGRTIETRTTTDVAGPSLAALQWRLERRFPDRWGRQRVEVTGADGGPVEVAVSPVEKLAAKVAEVRDRLDSQGDG